jgi:hypothetical protein
MEFDEKKDRKELELEIELVEEIETTDEGRKKIKVETIE